MLLTTNLTPAQVDALRPDAATDLLVAKHLFRLQAYEPHDNLGRPGYQGKGQRSGWHYLPRYSIDHTAMLEVLRLLVTAEVEVDFSGRMVHLRFRDRGRGGVDGGEC